MNVTLSLGSNIGDKAENLRLAVQLLGPTVSIRRISSFIRLNPGVTPIRIRFITSF